MEKIKHSKYQEQLSSNNLLLIIITITITVLVLVSHHHTQYAQEDNLIKRNSTW